MSGLHRTGWAFFALMAVFLPVTCFASELPASEQEWAAFFDPALEETMAQNQAPGAVVAVVHGDTCVFAKGFGTAALGKEVPVLPGETLFRVASISKLFTTIAVMQLVETGRLNINENVNTYLDTFKLHGVATEPVTLYNLLTHTAGFDERLLGMGARTRADLLPLGEYLARRMPPRVMEPGECVSYSNHGFALAGHIVEVASGMPFPEYAKTNILEPLGMTHSTFDPEPGPPLAESVTWLFGKNRPAVFDYPQTPPASSLTVTAEDMARFMRAMLRNGELEGKRILREDIAKMMMERHFAHRPEFKAGRAYGFSEEEWNGRRVLSHTGQIWGFTSIVLLIPEADCGLFVSCSTDRLGLYGAVAGRFMDTFFPAPEKEPVAAPASPPEDFTSRIFQCTGAYRFNRYSRSDFMKLGTAIPQYVSEVYVTPGKERGDIALRWNFNDRANMYTEIKPYLFAGVYERDGKRYINPDRLVAFNIVPSCCVTHLFIGDNAYERINSNEIRSHLFVNAGIGVAGVLLFLAAWPLRAWRRRKHAVTVAWKARWAERVLGLACLCFVAFPTAFGAFLLTVSPNQIGYGPPEALRAILCVPLVGGGLAALALLLALLPRRGMPWGWLARLHFLATLGAIAVFLMVLNYWNLLGFRFG